MTGTYRVFHSEIREIKGLEGHLKLIFKYRKDICVFIVQDTFGLWPFYLLKSNIHGLHILQRKEWQKSIKQQVFEDQSNIERPG